MDEKEIVDRLEAATTLLEKALGWFEERQSALSGQVERISATVEQTQRETELEQKLAAAERELTELRASAQSLAAANHFAVANHEATPMRRTVPAGTAEMLAKQGIGEGPVDVRTLDAALTGLSLEQRIAVKTQLQRAGALS